jgi:hypothetical protein
MTPGNRERVARWYEAHCGGASAAAGALAGPSGGIL